ncbi:MAG: CRTAC1 family protein [Planctomycetes bacterium]|nr:CRTAC1 family protein [Planctomycetota bacterium]
MFFVLFLLGCEQHQARETSIVFTEIASVIAPTVCGAQNPTQIIEVNGTGLALIDFDNDDDLDLFVVNASNAPCRMYENIGGESIRFIDVTDRLKMNIQGWANGVAVGDVNGDGFDDVYVTCHGQNYLLLNRSGTSFEDVTEFARVGDSGWGTSARFGDLDGDGDLDLYVCNYLEYDFENPPPSATYKGHSVLGGPHGMTAQSDVVYENVGDGSFKDVTSEWGFTLEPSFTLNAVILDFTDDGLQDVFVGNDSMANHLFVNTGETPTRFENRALKTGVATNGDGAMQATMGIAIADVNGNSRPDIFTTNFSSDTNTLHLNDASGFFDDRTKRFGLGLVSRSLLGWTCGFHDFDIDGDEDLFVVNGHVYPEATVETMDSAREQPVLLFERIGDRFMQVKQEGAFRDRAAVFGDLDMDGDTDVIVAQRNGEVRVLRNDSQHKQPWTVQLYGEGKNPRGLGAKLLVTFVDGTTATRWNMDGIGFQSSSATQKHVFAKPIASVEVTWLGGDTQLVTDFPNKSFIRIMKGQSP